jgi:hypothetical protein
MALLSAAYQPMIAYAQISIRTPQLLCTAHPAEHSCIILSAGERLKSLHILAIATNDMLLLLTAAKALLWSLTDVTAEMRFVNAVPSTTATASSTTVPRRMKSLQDSEQTDSDTSEPRHAFHL